MRRGELMTEVLILHGGVERILMIYKELTILLLHI